LIADSEQREIREQRTENREQRTENREQRTEKKRHFNTEGTEKTRTPALRASG